MTTSDAQLIGKRRFSLSGYGHMSFNEVYNFMKNYMFDRGYVPIHGTEVFNNEGGEWDYSCYGIKQVDPNLEYMTAEGYMKWRTAQDK